MCSVRRIISLLSDEFAFETLWTARDEVIGHLPLVSLLSTPCQALFVKLGLNGKPAHTAPLEPPLHMSERVVVTHRSVSGADGAVIDTEETQPLRQAA